MRVAIQPTPDAAARLAAEIVGSRIGYQPDLRLGLATGLTMIPLYQALVDDRLARAIAIPGLRMFGLDEFRDVPPEHPGSCRRFLETHLFSRLVVDRARIHVMDGQAVDPAAECRRYEALIAAVGGIDLQLLGIGANGHIGFNEPGPDFDTRTRVTRLSPQTRMTNAAAWDGRLDAVPVEALTLGIGTIREARTCLLVAVGSGKSAAVAAALEGPVSPAVPASVLQLHPDVTVVLDQAAASGLSSAPQRSADAR